jgi:hypothetical protein
MGWYNFGMPETQLQIVINAVNAAADQLSEVSDQLTQLGTSAGEASTAISGSLNAAEVAAADAAIATATQWDDSLEEVSTAVSEAATSASSSFASISESALAAANGMSEGWQASMAELQETMASADSEIVAAATTAGEEAGTAAGQGFGGYFKEMIVGYGLEQIGSFLSGGIESAVAAASTTTNKIDTLTAQIAQQRAEIQVHEAALQKWVGTTLQVNAAHQAAAADIDAEKVKITELTQQLAPLMQAQQGLPGQIQGIVDAVLTWIGAHKQLEAELQTFMTTFGPMLEAIGAGIIAFTLFSLAFSMLSPLTLILIAIGATVSLLTAIWATFHTQITAFFDDLNAKTGIITTFKQAWDSVVTQFNSNLKPALEQLWTALQPLMPYIEDLAEVALFLLVKEIQVLVPIIVGMINAFTDLLTIATKIETFFVNQLVAAINSVGNALNAVFNSTAFKAVSGLLGGAIGGISSAVNAVSGAAGSILKVNDAIITPSGQVIQTDVADYLFATKNPGAIGAAGGGASGAINIYIQGGNFLNQGGAQQIAAALATQIRQQLKLSTI